MPEEQTIEEIDPAVAVWGAAAGSAGRGLRGKHQSKRLLDQFARSHGPKRPARERRRGGPEQCGEGRLPREAGQRPSGDENRPIREQEGFRLRIVKDGKPPAFPQGRRPSIPGGEQWRLRQCLGSDFGNPGVEVRIPYEPATVLECTAGAPGGVNCRRVGRYRERPRR